MTHIPSVINNKDFSLLMAEVLKKGKAFRFQASGASMSPFIKSGDILTLVTANHRCIRIGDVVAFYHPHNANLTIHRIVKRCANTYLLKPDNSLQVDGWINRDAIIGIVQSVERGERPYNLGLGWEKWWIANLSRWNLLRQTTGIFWRIFPNRVKKRIKGI